ncbi:MAG: FkbM family methyltransferase [Candidatus Berkiellales bacterium]
MKQTWQILKYIIDNNPWHQVPMRIVMAIFYQGYKRTIKGIFTKKLFNGTHIFLFPNNPISSAFIYAPFPDQVEILALRQLADENTIFLDIGANVGAYSILLADKVKDIWAFEAHPQTAQFCKMNFILNDRDANFVIPRAVGDNSQPKYFTNSPGGDPVNTQIVDPTNAIVVPAIVLDNFVVDLEFSKNDNYLVKIDVEGFEHEVFAGAKNFLKDYPVRAVLFEAFSEKNGQIIEMLKSLGFTIQYITPNNILATRQGMPHG